MASSRHIPGVRFQGAQPPPLPDCPQLPLSRYPNLSG